MALIERLRNLAAVEEARDMQKRFRKSDRG